MFDTVWGLPVHTLVIHLVVVVGPASTLLAVAYAARSRWRRALRVPVMVGAVLTGLGGLAAGESGEHLERRVLVAPEIIDLAPLQKHAEAGDIAKVLCLIFMVVTLVVVITVGPQAQATPGRPLLQHVGVVLLGLVAAGTLVSLVVTGYLGAEATWSTLVRDTSQTTALFGG